MVQVPGVDFTERQSLVSLTLTFDLVCKQNQSSTTAKRNKLLFVRTQIHGAVDDPRVAIDIHCSELATRQILTGVDGRRA